MYRTPEFYLHTPGGGVTTPIGMPGQEECHGKQTSVFIVTMESNRLLKKRMTIMPPEKVTNVPSRSCCFFVLAAPGHTARVNQKARKVDTGQHTSGGLARI